ncbi:cell division protein ZipA C-terminal FtsZ-binding domain-containing protein [Noviherbaspirillum aridicola]|uniref:Cell division protein ZipA n=1 Tax=Noviherbaspirillum aridicola TaxID=2849687 RepID=A0ABQ4Q1W6_9BURK|nr:cell division protein ZipA C-terminal FtsZ-binding domain-containing protein [Noviherbaspirillum aridicola]GIZ51181.1 cell division protein ZipA [Noviherbaspirillum aridicola]
MTDLHASLLAVGGTIVVGVLGYNKWQEYKAKKAVQRAFASEHDDVLMTPAHEVGAAEIPPEQERQEPVFDAGPPAAEDNPVAVADAPVAAQAAAPEPAPAVQEELPIDELIDCAIPLALEAPVRGERLLSKLQGLRHVGNKPVHFVGQREDGSWGEIGHGTLYYGLYAGVQLANRAGALNEIEYSELISRLRQVADEIDAEPEVPDMKEVMGRARALHQFVAEYDAQLSVNVQGKGAPWAIGTLLGALERQGFDLRPDGRLVMPDGEGGVLFSLSTNVTLAAETTSRLTLLLDVPRVSPAHDGFGAMTACARMLAARLDGVVVDDGSQPLTDAALADIAQQVNDFYAQMEAAQVPAGSTRAQRLFS